MTNKIVFLDIDGTGQLWHKLPELVMSDTPVELVEYELVPTGRTFKLSNDFPRLHTEVIVEVPADECNEEMHECDCCGHETTEVDEAKNGMMACPMCFDYIESGEIE